MRRAVLASFCLAGCVSLAVGCSEGDDAGSFCEQVAEADVDLLADPSPGKLEALQDLEQAAPDEIAEELSTMIAWLELTVGDEESSGDVPSDSDIEELGVALQTFIAYVDEECGIQV